MARVRLFQRPAGELRFSGSVPDVDYKAIIPLHYLMVTLVVVPRDADADYRPDSIYDPWCPDAVVDTGAPLSVFPYTLWAAFADQIWWLDQPPRSDGLAREITLLGGNWTYRLGRVRVGAIDDDGDWLPPVWLNAFFLDDLPDAPKTAVLGLRSRLWVQRQLRSAGDVDDDTIPDWWIEDA